LAAANHRDADPQRVLGGGKIATVIESVVVGNWTPAGMTADVRGGKGMANGR
jgi:hypothetical protein